MSINSALPGLTAKTPKSLLVMISSLPTALLCNKADTGLLREFLYHKGGYLLLIQIFVNGRQLSVLFVLSHDL